MENNLKNITKKANLLILGFVAVVVVLFVLVRLSLALWGYESIQNNGEVDVKDKSKYIYYNFTRLDQDDSNINGKLYSLDGKLLKEARRYYYFSNNNLVSGKTNNSYYYVENLENDFEIYYNDGSEDKKLVLSDSLKKAMSAPDGTTYFGVEPSPSGKYFYIFSTKIASPYGIEKLFVYDAINMKSEEMIVEKFKEKYNFDIGKYAMEIYWAEDSDVLELKKFNYSSTTGLSNEKTKYTYSPATGAIGKSDVAMINDPRVTLANPDDIEIVTSDSIGPWQVFESYFSMFFRGYGGLFSNMFNLPFAYYQKSCKEITTCSAEYSEENITEDTYLKLNMPVLGKQSVVFVDSKKGEEKELMSWFSIWNRDRVRVMLIKDTDLALVLINERVFLVDKVSGDYKHLFDTQKSRETNPFSDVEELTIFVN